MSAIDFAFLSFLSSKVVGDYVALVRHHPRASGYERQTTIRHSVSTRLNMPTDVEKLRQSLHLHLFLKWTFLKHRSLTSRPVALVSPAQC